jgi:chemotaxis-related protein WspB
MHVVIWTSKGDCYATPSSSVIEVIPMVQSRPIAASQDWLAGVFDFRGQLLPLIDSSRMLGNAASLTRMSSRILVILTSDDPALPREVVGLIVESVLGCDNLDFEEQKNHQLATDSGLNFLGPLAQTPRGMVQLTVPIRFPRSSHKVYKT